MTRTREPPPSPIEWTSGIEKLLVGKIRELTEATSLTLFVRRQLRRTRPLAEGSHLGVTAAYQIESNSYGECRHTTPTSVVVPPIYVGGLLSRLGEGGRREHKELTSTTIMLPMLFIPTLEPFPPIPERYAAPRIEFVAPDENVRTGMRVAALSNPISIIL